MKPLYLILILLALVFGILTMTGVMPFFNLNTVLCISSSMPQLFNPEFDLALFFESCGR